MLAGEGVLLAAVTAARIRRVQAALPPAEAGQKSSALLVILGIDGGMSAEMEKVGARRTRSGFCGARVRAPRYHCLQRVDRPFGGCARS